MRRCLLLLLLCCCSAAQAEENLASRIEAILDQPRYRETHWGVLFVDLESGKTLYSRNPDKLFAPASVTKTYSVAAALAGLGADYRFETPVVRRGEVDREGVLAGDLVLIASGDLTMGGRTKDQGELEFTNSDHIYATFSEDASLTSADPLSGLNDLARQVAAAGIKRVTGKILIDDRLFQRGEGSGSGPSTISPIVINDNVLDFLIEPTKAGERAKLTWRPQTAMWNVESQVETAEEGTKAQVSVRSNGRKIVLTGRVPAGRAPLVRIYEAPDPAEFARGLFIEALNRAGVATADTPHAAFADVALPPREATLKLPRVALLRSVPFAENARLILKVSHNLHASTLPYLLAAKHGERTFSAGMKREGDFLKSAGVDIDTISFGGGAGGSRADYVTPTATVQLLRHMASRPDFAAYKRALPILGVDGTLAKAVAKDSPLRGQVLAKTGTLLWDNGLRDKPLITSKALAGYLTTKGERQVLFALFANNVQAGEEFGAKEVGQDLAKLCQPVWEAH
jgi:D-alanyl-D-alanine carboxypeptidase/D-alanyl-D-alanine-endopeptidase (penicillin-binding protein 4)